MQGRALVWRSRSLQHASLFRQRCRQAHCSATGPTRRQRRGSPRPTPQPSPADGPREVVVGIDLGTTNSAIAVIEGGKPRCIPNPQGSNLTPSVVSFQEDGSVLVGRDARRMAASQPSTTYSSVKRLIGRQYDDPLVQQELRNLSYKVGQDEEGAVILQCSAVDRGFLYPEEVSAQVLGQLLADAERFTGGHVSKAIISVPAYFNTRQREAIVAAGKLAGLDTIRILREPVAAALSFGLDLKKDMTVLVFDLGGGTYDVSILEVGNGTIEVLSTGGDAHLGGDDWDAAIVDWLKREHLAPFNGKGRPATGQGQGVGGLDLDDPKTQANLKALAEAAKIRLSNAEQVTLRIPGARPDGGVLSVELTRDKLDELTEELWRRCRLPLDQACWNAGVDLEEAVGQLEARKKELQSRGVPAWKTATLKPSIQPKKRSALTTVLLVGGATRMPAVRQFLRNMTAVEPMGGPETTDGGVDPDEAVALGAAVQAGVLQGEVQGLMVMDQWQASLMRALADMKLRTDPAAKAAISRQFSMSDDDGDDEQYGEVVDEAEEETGSGSARPVGSGPTSVLVGSETATTELERAPLGPDGKRLTKRAWRRQQEREAKAAAAANAGSIAGTGTPDTVEPPQAAAG